MTEPLPASPVPSIVGWIVAGTLDARLAALLWLLVEGGVSVVVAGAREADGRVLLAALHDLAGAQTRAPAPSRLPSVVEGRSLEEVRALLAAPPVAASEDELRGLGAVVVLDAVSPGRRRVIAAHFVRPIERDGKGHLQRRPPALLAAWDAAQDTFDDYSWGVVAELAERVGRHPGDFERELARRSALLGGLVASVH